MTQHDANTLAANKVAPSNLITRDFALEVRDEIRACLETPAQSRSRALLRDWMQSALLNSRFDKLIANPAPETYDRTIILTDTAYYFSLMLLTWAPGASTPIHGHNSYGVVGVYSGEIAVECFERVRAKDGTYRLNESFRGVSARGTVADTHSGAAGIHRLSNPTPSRAVSIHLYRMDLSDDPLAINDVYEDSSRPFAFMRATQVSRDNGIA